jgi:AraC family transcriptional regulator of adaptative response/methylated-DNA-[protein]-cysteine methyltransferase
MVTMPVAHGITPSTSAPRTRDAVDDERWLAVLERDERADDTFVYGVVTTGVYCRPSCPSRRPRRDNVRLFGDPANARAAGLRPCRRCDPDGPPPSVRRAELVAAACRLLDRAERPLPSTELARRLGVSSRNLDRTFVAVLGVTPRGYAAARRADRVVDALAAAPSVTDAVWAAGYESPARFHADVTARRAMTPSAVRSGGSGERIDVAVAPSGLGLVLVARTERGVCSVMLGDDPDELLGALRQRFRRAELVAAADPSDEVLRRVVEAVEHPGDGDQGIPLDVRGTAFQERVWRALRAVPAGTTTTYGGLAGTIGAPRSVRAVAGACAANPLAVLVPCHRVVGRDGSLTGYRWGLDRKAELLRREAGEREAGIPRPAEPASTLAPDRVGSTPRPQQ